MMTGQVAEASPRLRARIAGAFYLITIAASLKHVSDTVGTVLIGIRAIAHQTEPLGPVVKDIVADVRGIENDLATLVSGAQSAARIEPARSSRREIRAGRGR
jgi:hypothetical protein